MAFLPDFETDIFISYARVDNETATRGEGWVAQFVKHLEIELNRLAGRIGLVKLWWDPTLDDNQLFDVKIQKQINGAALFLALTSNGYLKSDYCRKELRWFRERAEQHQGLIVGDRLRVVNVMLNNIPPRDWPDEFQGAIGSKFHDAERDGELGQPPMPGEKLFRKQLRKLSESIYRTLLEFPSAKTAPSPAPKPEDAFVVFLAEVSNTLETRRESVAHELRQQGVQVIDNIPPPHPSADHDEAVKTEIARADLAVHLLNDLRGTRVIDDASRRYPQRQVELGLEFAKSQLIWVPPSLNQKAIAKIEDPAHRELLNRLENGDREQARYRFLRESPSAIAREVINRLKELKELDELKRRQQAEAAALIDTHLKDQFRALELGRAIEENLWQPLINPSVDDPALSAQILSDRLKKACKLIVLFGEVAESWVDGRLREALHIALNTPNCPLRKLAVCFVKPQRKDAGIRFDLGFVPIHHFDLEELLDRRTLAEFLKS